MRPDRNTVLMETAVLWAQRGTCSRAKVGCVIARDGRILVQGYNGTPSGMVHCSHECDCWLESGHRISCNSLNPCTKAVHAEANAVAYAARVGVSLQDTELFTTKVPCTNCAMLLINAGIIRVSYQEDHRDMGGLALLYSVGIAVQKVDRITA